MNHKFFETVEYMLPSLYIVLVPFAVNAGCVHAISPLVLLSRLRAKHRSTMKGSSSLIRRDRQDGDSFEEMSVTRTDKPSIGSEESRDCVP